MKTSSNLAYVAANAAADKKATDIRLLNVEGLTTVTDFFVVCTGNSTTQVKAIAQEIEFKMEEEGLEIIHKEGHQFGRWILLDYGYVIAHVFIEEEREFYGIERLWSDAEEIIF
ncbi:MAG: ribosome silencing factor [Clostridium sp.]|uniref:ribosome silencing factor n=1 Tax=Clostridium sp. TaxID=1506 RepID=UPI002FCA8258